MFEDDSFLDLTEALQIDREKKMICLFIWKVYSLLQSN